MISLLCVLVYFVGFVVIFQTDDNINPDIRNMKLVDLAFLLLWPLVAVLVFLAVVVEIIRRAFR